MIPEPGDLDREVPFAETFHEQTDEEFTEKEVKQMKVDDQGIQTILMGLPEDIYVVVDSCETAQKIWLCVQQMMKGSDIGLQKKKDKLFNEWKESSVSTLKGDLECLTLDLSHAEIVRHNYVRKLLPTAFQRLLSNNDRHNYVRKLLPTAFQRLLSNNEYKKILSDVFNQAIVIGWSEGIGN
nr:hypothetical protein [Tanacetum cinerariifolium]